MTEIENQRQAPPQRPAGEGRRTPAIHAAIAELARSVLAEPRPHPEDVLENFALLASTHISGVGQAGVMLLSGRRGLHSASASGGLSHLIDKTQEELQEGPCLEVMQGPRLLRVDDLAYESRWPRFTAAVLEQTSVRSLLCYRLYTDIHDWGALSMYTNAPHAFDREAQDAGAILATHAALTMEAVNRNRQFRAALGSRDIIGQAKGVLMERYDISATAAFALLTRLSGEANKPVVAIAKEIVETKPKPKH